MSTNAVSAGGFIIDGEATTTSETVTASHVHRINGYSQIKGLGNGKYITSTTFSLGGHRWFIRYYPNNGCVENSNWVSVYLCHDNSDDAVDVKARLKFSIVHDIGERESMFSQQGPATFSPNHRYLGFNKFVLRKTLEESSYLKDDCLKVRCDVTIANDTKQFVDVPPSNMYQHFGSLLSGTVGADVTFEIAGEMFAGHRCVLAARSPVFMAELFGSMKEKIMDCIQIQDMEPSVFKAMLHFIYTDTLPDIDRGDVIIELLLVAADRYDLERLKLICEYKICKSMSIGTSTVAATQALAERHGCHGLKKACFEFLKSPSHLKTVMATDGFDHLMTTCPSLIKELLAKVASCP